MASKALVSVFAVVAFAGCGDNVHLGKPTVKVSPVSGLETTEAGGQATFTIVLEGKPFDDVIVDLSSSNVGEGTVSPAALTFTRDDFNAPQIVTVTGVQDEIADGPQSYQILVAPSASGDPRFEGVKGDDVSITNIDDDSAGIRVMPTSGLVTTEAGGTAQFAVVLNSKPGANVTVPISSSDTGEGTVSPALLTFTPDNWNAPQTVTVTGIDDDLDDGSQSYKALTGAATSTDSGYNGLDAGDVDVSNTDDDTAGVTVTPTTGLHTSEDGGQATFTVKLNTQPTADVTIPIISMDVSEGTTDVTSLTFTPANWNAPQTVTITGVDDQVADGDQPYVIATDPATSSDSSYQDFDAGDVAVTNTDNDSAGFTLSATSGLVTTEGGGTATFTIRLTSQPTANVTIAVSSNDTTEGTVSPTTLTFTPTNWNAPQTVRLTGVDDLVADGDQVYSITTGAASSSDNNYNGRDPADVSATNTDNDSAGFTVTPTSGLTTTEAGGQATFTIVLNSQPTADVTVPLSSSNTDEGTVSPSGVTFTPANWNAPQTVTITGVDDLVADGGQLYTIFTGPATSGDAGYLNRNPDDVTVTNTDNDSAGITVSKQSITTTEGGGQGTFTIVLNSQPTANVTIPISSSDTTEGTVNTSSVTFTPTDWNAPQTITVTGVNDFIADGDQTYTITTGAATSSDGNYSGRNAADVSATNVDNDSPGIIVSPLSGLQTKETGATATFTIVLASQPTASVTIGLSSSDTTEGTVNFTSVTFTTVNWNAPQTITVTGVDDAVQDGDQPYKIITANASSSDGQYNNRDVDDVLVTNLDNDIAGILVNPTSGLVTDEAGTSSATFGVVLRTQPTSDVTVSITSNDPSEGIASPATLTFTPVNWNAPQIVTVTGVDDSIQDGNQPYKITVGAAISADNNYNNIDPPDVDVTNIDNDTAGIRVTPTSGLTTTESGGTASFNVQLETQPLADVTIPLSSSDTTEGTITQTSLTFTPANWNSPQTVTVTGVNDALVDGDQPYSIILGAASSSDARYDLRDAPDVQVVNLDNDQAGVIVSPISGLVTTETGDTAFFTIVLKSQPAADVSIDITSSDTTEGVPQIANVTFTPANWNLPQTVTINGIDDALTDGDQVYTIKTSATSSTDPAFNGLPVDDVSATNMDNDIPGFTVNPTGGLQTAEFGDFDTFTIVLNAAPTADVTIPLSINDTTEATLGAVTSVTFTTLNWNVPQTVTVTGVNDLLADGNQPFLVVTGPAISTDTNYSGLNPPDIDGTNVDDDTPGVYIKARRLLRTSESGQNTFFRVRLTTQPTADVTCQFASSDVTEGTISVPSLTFTAANFATMQTINVFGVDDTIKDGDTAYTIITGPCTSADPSYNTAPGTLPDPRDVSVLNRDND